MGIFVATGLHNYRLQFRSLFGIFWSVWLSLLPVSTVSRLSGPIRYADNMDILKVFTCRRWFASLEEVLAFNVSLEAVQQLVSE